MSDLIDALKQGPGKNKPEEDGNMLSRWIKNMGRKHTVHGQNTEDKEKEWDQVRRLLND